MLHRELLVEAIDRFLGAGSLEDHGIVLPDGNGVLAVGGIGLHHVRARDVAGNLDVAGCRLIAGLRSDQRIVLGMAFNSSLASSGKAVASMVGLVGSDDSVFCWLFWVVVEVPSFFWMAQPGHTKAESTARIITTAAATTTAINLPWDCVVEEFSLLVMPRFSHSRVTLGGRNFSRCAQAA